MTRISSLLIASTLAILPISAFAQQTATPAKTTEPAGVMTTTKTPATGVKTDTRAMTTVKTQHTKTNVPAKTTEPAKS
jgi:hypothetical protein